MQNWQGKLTRIQAIAILELVTYVDDAAWEGAVAEFYNESDDTMPSIYDVLDALGVTESEYKEATGSDHVEWPKQSDSVNNQ